MRAMPSPTSSTRPTSSTVFTPDFSLAFSISGIRTETISSGLNFMTATLDQLIAEDVELMTHAGIIAPVADLYDEPAQQVGIDGGVQDRFFLGQVPQLVDQALALVVRQWDGGADEDADAVGALLDQLRIGDLNRPEQLHPLVVIEDEQEIEQQRGDAA